MKFEEATGGVNHIHSETKKVVETLEQELHSLTEEKLAINKKLTTVKRTLVGLVTLFGDGILNEELRELVGEVQRPERKGVTDACRAILLEATKPMTAREVVESLQRSQPELMVNHKDPLASVTTILSRLENYGEARVVVNEKGHKTWESAGQPDE